LSNIKLERRRYGFFCGDQGAIEKINRPSTAASSACNTLVQNASIGPCPKKPYLRAEIPRMADIITKRILGIDPGTNALGFAIIDANKKNIQVLEIGVLTFAHISDEHTDKLKYIFEQVQDIIRQYEPAEMAIEAPFFGKNVQSMLKLGRAQGVAMAAGMVQGLAITEYMPKKIKSAVTGNGNASKEQVAGMLESILKTKFTEKSLDATDALATALCHWYQSSGPLGSAKKSYSGWSAFLKDKPERVKK
jgi:crossover junction endodeoxyribonuclease RuvC